MGYFPVCFRELISRTASALFTPDTMSATLTQSPPPISFLSQTNKLLPVQEGSEDISNSHNHFSPSARQSTHTPLESGTSILSRSLPSCECLQMAAYVLEELETRNSKFDHTSSLDGVLAFHKQASGYCDTMVNCQRCTSRSEHMMLLTFICEKLVILCEKTSTLFLRQLKRTRGSPNWQESTVIGNQIGGPSCPKYIGEYEIDVPQEWNYLIRVLVFIRLERLGSLVARMKAIASTAKRDTQLSMLQNTERRVREVIKMLRPS